jgi:hypothetical protein
VSSWVWLALSPASAVDQPPADTALTVAVAEVRRGDGWTGTLTAWPAGPRPVRGARRADAALIDPRAHAARAVVQWLPEGREPLFDDPAVQHTLRLLTAWPAGPTSTLTRNSTHYCGAIQVLPAGAAGDGWPLRALGPTPVYDVGPGLLAARPRTLHGTQRNAGAPWPATAAPSHLSTGAPA